MRNPIVLPLLLSLPFAAAASQGPGGRAADTVSVPISSVSYGVALDRMGAATGTFSVRMCLNAAASGSVVLSLPAGTPGAYEPTTFARGVLGFNATAGGK